MSMTGSMCVSMTGRPTRLQIANEQRRQRYGYLQTAKENYLNKEVQATEFLAEARACAESENEE